MGNTLLARQLADIYERLNSCRFPGGIMNATIVRTYAGRHQRAAGAWLWFLSPLTGQLRGLEIVGSQWTATECASASLVTIDAGDGPGIELIVEKHNAN